MKTICLSILLGSTLSLATAPIARWGFSGHQLIVDKAVDALPESGLRLFALENRRFLVQHTMDPDKRRNDDPSEGPNHYIDLELFGIRDSSAPQLLTGFPEPKPASSDDGAEAKPRGRLPWRIEEVYERLVLEMKTGGWEQAKLSLAELAHYLADSTVPYHATENYDGQLTGQKGAHARFEEWLVDLQLVELQSEAGPDVPVRRLDANGRRGAIWDSIRSSFREVPGLLEADRESMALPSEEEQGKHFLRKKGGLVRKRIAQGIWLVAAFWHSAWIDAGSPEPLLLAPKTVHPSDKVFSAEEAGEHVGEEATIEYRIVKVGRSQKSGTIYLNSHEPHEGHFAAVVFPDAQQRIADALGQPLGEKLEGKRVRVRGKIQFYKKAPEIILEKPEQISLVP